MTDYEAAVEVREALVAIAEQLEGLNVIAERVDTLNTTATRIAVALEIMAMQTRAAHRAELGPIYDQMLAEELRSVDDEPA